MAREIILSAEDWKPRNILSIVGPTGSGKTRLALDLVQKHFAKSRRGPLLVSVDAVAAYRELNIGSAKVCGPEHEEYDWAGIDLYAPTEQINAMGFAQKIWPQLSEARQQERPIILVGGSHFYERVLVEGKSIGAASDPDYQKALENLPLRELSKKLNTLDSRWSAKLHPNDRYRLGRVLDLSERQGFSFDEIYAEPTGFFAAEKVQTLILGLELSRDEAEVILRSRIDKMFRDGWTSEVEAILGRHGADAPALQSVGYFEICEMLAGRISTTDTQELILIRHQQLAKKQRTWLRGLDK